MIKAGGRRELDDGGFTIVELLIVIVVIGILAAITIVAFNGIQARAAYTAYKSDIQSINKAIQLYYADNGSYPTNGTSTCSVGNTTSNVDFVFNLVPTYLAKTPVPRNYGNNYYAYCHRADGSNYKLIRLVSGGSTLPDVEMADTAMLDPVRTSPASPTTRAWGYWSPGCATTC